MLDERGGLWYADSMKPKTVPKYNSAPSHRLSNAAVNKIAAVEGIELDGEIQREFDEFERLGLTDDEKLAAIKAKFTQPQQ